MLHHIPYNNAFMRTNFSNINDEKHVHMALNRMILLVGLRSHFRIRIKNYSFDRYDYLSFNRISDTFYLIISSILFLSFWLFVLLLGDLLNWLVRNIGCHWKVRLHLRRASCSCKALWRFGAKETVALRGAGSCVGFIGSEVRGRSRGKELKTIEYLTSLGGNYMEIYKYREVSMLDLWELVL